MASETKTFCDRCRKDITRTTWRAILRLPKKIKLKMLYDNGYSEADKEFDLCEDCMHDVFRILRGVQDGK